MSFTSRCAALALLFAGLPSFAHQAPVDEATAALVAQLSDHYAHEYRAARRVHSMPGTQGVKLVFFTLEGFNGGNNYTYYLAAFQQVMVSEQSARYQLLGFNEIGGAGWRSVDFEHFETVGGCVVLSTKEYASGDPMSHPTVPGTAAYCLSSQEGIPNLSLEPIADGKHVSAARIQR